MKHEPAIMVYSHRSNKKHVHHTRRGTQQWNHWFTVYRCPVCGRTASRKRQPVRCTGGQREQGGEKESSFCTRRTASISGRQGKRRSRACHRILNSHRNLSRNPLLARAYRQALQAKRLLEPRPRLGFRRRHDLKVIGSDVQNPGPFGTGARLLSRLGLVAEDRLEKPVAPLAQGHPEHYLLPAHSQAGPQSHPGPHRHPCFSRAATRGDDCPAEETGMKKCLWFWFGACVLYVGAIACIEYTSTSYETTSPRGERGISGRIPSEIRSLCQLLLQ
jgi:hypothetical protein